MLLLKVIVKKIILKFPLKNLELIIKNKNKVTYLI